MSTQLPELADPWRLVEFQNRFSGKERPDAFTRLADAVEAIGRDVGYELRFGKDDEGRAVIEGRVMASVTMVCQRCLSPVDLEIDSSFILGLVGTDTEAERLQDELDTIVVDEQPMRILNLVEDEILLSLPQVPMHEQGDCGAVMESLDNSIDTSAQTDNERDNPFAALAALKVKDSNDS